jgi:hypothetical protein
MSAIPMNSEVRTPVWLEPKPKDRAPDPIRVLGWLLLLFVPLTSWSSVRFADTQTNRNVMAWVTMESRSMSMAAAPVLDVVRMLRRGLVPSRLEVSPWPGLAASFLLALVGVVLLLVRPRASSHGLSGLPKATVATIPPWERLPR